MLHQGLAELTGLSIGVVSIVVGAGVLLLWIPLRQRPGLGTVSNVFVVGLAMDGTLALLPDARSLAVRVPLLVAGIVLNGAATGLYIAARFGPGPRDGLMTGLHRRTGRSIRLMRTAVEVTVVVTGFVLGGTIGVGTVLYAVSIGRAGAALPAHVRRPVGTVGQHRWSPARNRGGPYCVGDLDDTAPAPPPTWTTQGRSPSPTGAGRRTAWRTPWRSSGARWSWATGTSRPTCTPRRTAGWSPSTTRDAGPGHRRRGPDRRPAVGGGPARARGRPGTGATVRGAAGDVPRGALERRRQGGARAAAPAGPDRARGRLGPGLRGLLLRGAGAARPAAGRATAGHLVRHARGAQPAAALLGAAGRGAPLGRGRAGARGPVGRARGRSPLRPRRPRARAAGARVDGQRTGKDASAPGPGG